jgi:hypothetical protein
MKPATNHVSSDRALIPSVTKLLISGMILLLFTPLRIFSSGQSCLCEQDGVFLNWVNTMQKQKIHEFDIT